MCIVAPISKRKMKTDAIGISTVSVGNPPGK